MKKPPVIVVGAGIGGLTSALHLAAKGVDVLVLEAAAQPGGKMREVCVDGVAMDAGPTVFTMRWVFDELFASIGERLEDHLGLRPLNVLARHAWGPDERLDLLADKRASCEAIGRFAGADAARGYLAFCERARGIFQTLDKSFLRDSRPTPLSLTTRVGWRGLPGLMRISPWTTLWKELGVHFTDPRLRQLFGRYATYCGSSPFLSPATLMLVAHVEQEGVWRVDGGMHRVAQTLAALVRKQGATVRCDAPVDEILVRDGKACGVRLVSGETLQAEAVVFNGDAAALREGLLGGAPRRAVAALPAARRSLSAVTWNLRVRTSGFPLSRHTVFFSNDYAAEFADIARKALPRAPTVYVCAQDRGDDDVQVPSGAERLLLIVNAPATGDGPPFSPEELLQCQTQTFHWMERCGLQLAFSPERCAMTTPQDFERLFPATGGALYGQASHGWMASFRRPASRSRLPGLYLAGGSVHPGPGVPMAALSGRQAAASLWADRRSRPALVSTSPSRPVATHGGTSMP